jgi:hypothetical protein
MVVIKNWKYLQCILLVPHSLLEVESEAAPSNVWISDVLFLASSSSQGEDTQVDAGNADSSALIRVDRANAWITGVSFVASSGSMTRAVLLKDSSVFLGGETPASFLAATAHALLAESRCLCVCCFPFVSMLNVLCVPMKLKMNACAECMWYGLELETPSPVLLLDTGTAYFSGAAFNSIKGPPACGTMHVYAGAVALEKSVWSRTDARIHHNICLADVTSLVYADSPVTVTNLEGGGTLSTADLSEAAEHTPGFLYHSDIQFLNLVQARRRPH